MQSALYAIVASLSILSWFVIGSLILKRSAPIPLPTSIEGCAERNITAFIDEAMYVQFINVHPFFLKLLNSKTKNYRFATTQAPIIDDTLFIYRISYPWLSFIGTVITLLVGIPLSHLIGPQDTIHTLDPNLVSPYIRFLMPNRKSIELAEISVKNNVALNLTETKWVWKENEDKLEKDCEK